VIIVIHNKSLVSLVILFVIIAFGGILKGALAGENEKNVRMPDNLRPNQIWVSSVPVGLNFSVISGSRTIRKGRTPLMIELDPGLYTIRVEGNRISLKDKHSTLSPSGEEKKKMINEILCITDTNKWEVRDVFSTSGDDRVLYLEYRVKKEGDKPLSLIALCQPTDKKIEALDSFFPKGNNFNFEEVALTKNLVEKGISETDIEKILSLLRRGGKIALRNKMGNPLYIEIRYKNDWKIEETIGKVLK